MRELKKLAPLVLLLILSAASNGLTATPPGFDAASFARLGMGVRAQAMGGAFVAVAQGATAGYWNPAGLASLTKFEAEMMYTDWFGLGINFQYISIAGYPSEISSALKFQDRAIQFGLSWLSVHIGDIPWWEEERAMDTFDAWSHLVIASFGWQLEQSPSISFGTNLKLYHDRMLEGKSFGIGADIGILWHQTLFGVPITVGLVTSDLGNTKIKWYGTTGEPINYVPWIMRVGIAAQILNGAMTISTSYEWGVTRPRFERLRGGVELVLGVFAVRAGYNCSLSSSLGTGSWTFGIGISPSNWLALEYALLPSQLGDSHLLAIRLLF